MKHFLLITLINIAFLTAFISCEKEDETLQICINEEAEIKNEYNIGERISLTSCSGDQYRWVFHYHLNKSDTLTGASIEYLIETHGLSVISVLHLDNDEQKKSFQTISESGEPTIVKQDESAYQDFTGIVTNDNNFVLYGNYDSSNDFLLKLSPNLTVLDHHTYPGLSTTEDFAFIETPFGYLVISNATYNVGIRKLDSDFQEIEMHYLLDGTWNPSVAISDQGKFVVSSYSEGSLNSGNRLYILDQNADHELTYTINPAIASSAELHEVKRYQDKYYLLMQDLKLKQPVVVVLDNEFKTLQEFHIDISSDNEDKPQLEVSSKGLLIKTGKSIALCTFNGGINWTLSRQHQPIEILYLDELDRFYLFSSNGGVAVLNSNGEVIHDVEYNSFSNLQKVFFIDNYFHVLGQTQEGDYARLSYWKLDTEGALVLD